MAVSHWSTRRRTLLIVLLCGAGLASLSSTAHAATTITVTGRTDELEPNGVCSLREAIQAANTDAAVDACPAGSGADTIVLDRGSYLLGGNDPRTQPPLEITSDIALEGAHDTIIFGYLPTGTITIQRGSVTITNVAIDGGRAAEGGAVRNAGTLAVRASFVRGYGCFGGALFNDTAGILTITDSEIYGSSSFPCRLASGAGIYNRGTMTLSNTLIRENRLEILPTDDPATQPSSGGGIFNAGTATLDFVSVIDNRAVYGDGGGILNTGTLRVSNTLMARNGAAGPGQDCAGTLESGGHNLIEQLGGCALRGTGPSDLLGQDPKLPLRYDDAPPPPWLLGFGSPAIDAADGATCPATDVWGTPRPVDGNADGRAACDIGAYELPAAHRVWWLPEIMTLKR